MNKKVSLGVCISLVIIAVTASFAGTMVFSKQIYNRIISNISQRAESYDAANEIYKLISDNFYGKLDDFNNNLDAHVAKGYVDGLGDSNCCYMSSSEYAEYINRTEIGITGAGVETGFNGDKNEMYISYDYEGAPAKTAGLEAGDVILSVNGTQVPAKNRKSLAAKFYGTKLQTVSLEYERAGAKNTAELIMGFSIPSVIVRDVDGAGYIRISRFYKKTPEEFETALAAIKESGTSSVVIDVRNTNEGTIEYASQTVDVIVGNVTGNIATAKYKNGKTKTFNANAGDYNDMDFAVLINSGTSGPAELFAVDIKDISHASLVGTTTAGVGTMQEIFTLEDGSAIRLTTALIVPYSELSSYNETGVSPTGDEIPMDESADILMLSSDEDIPLKTAAAILAENYS